MSDYGQKHSLSLTEMLEQEVAEKRKQDLWIIRLHDIEAYRNRWETITDKLHNLGH